MYNKLRYFPYPCPDVFGNQTEEGVMEIVAPCLLDVQYSTVQYILMDILVHMVWNVTGYRRGAMWASSFQKDLTSKLGSVVARTIALNRWCKARYRYATCMPLMITESCCE